MSHPTRVSGERGVVLHTRPYRETSLIAHIMTHHHGRIAAVAKGARGRRRSHDLQPFNEVALGWSGRGSMVTLTSYEAATHPWLKGEPMAAAFYVVELVMRLVAEHESLPRVYGATAWAMESLALGSPSVEIVLRSFEKLLLQELGYAVDFARDADEGMALEPQRSYALALEHGFVPATQADDAFLGEDLLRIAAEDFSQPTTRRVAKRVFRRLLGSHLGPKPLASRRLLLRGTR